MAAAQQKPTHMSVESWATLLDELKIYMQKTTDLKQGSVAPYIGNRAVPDKLYKQIGVSTLYARYRKPDAEYKTAEAGTDYNVIHATQFEAKDVVEGKRNIKKDHDNLMAFQQALTAAGLYVLAGEFVVATTGIAFNDNPGGQTGGWFHPLGIIDLLMVDRRGNLVIGDLKTLPPPSANVRNPTVDKYLMRQDYFFQMELYSLLLQYVAANMGRSDVKVAYHVLLTQDTYGGEVRVNKIPRNDRKWLGAEGIENDRFPLYSITNMKIIQGAPLSSSSESSSPSRQIESRKPVVHTPSGRPACLQSFDELVKSNTDFVRVIETTSQSQIVIMCLRPGEDIGTEIHSQDQFVYVVSARGGNVQLGDNTCNADTGFAVDIPGGTRHNVTNNGTTNMHFYLVYSPPSHPAGEVIPRKRV